MKLEGIKGRKEIQAEVPNVIRDTRLAPKSSR